MTTPKPTPPPPTRSGRRRRRTRQPRVAIIPIGEFDAAEYLAREES